MSGADWTVDELMVARVARIFFDAQYSSNATIIAGSYAGRPWPSSR